MGGSVATHGRNCGGDDEEGRGLLGVGVVVGFLSVRLRRRCGVSRLLWVSLVVVVVVGVVGVGVVGFIITRGEPISSNNSSILVFRMGKLGGVDVEDKEDDEDDDNPEASCVVVVVVAVVVGAGGADVAPAAAAAAAAANASFLVLDFCW